MTRRSLRRAVVSLVATVLAASVALVFPMSQSASAIGYPIQYRLTNATTEFLTYKWARLGHGAHCSDKNGGPIVECDKVNGKPFSAYVNPKTVAPGRILYIDYELDIGQFTIPSAFTVEYYLGTGGAQVWVHDSGQRVTCVVHHTREFTCVETGFRTFRLQRAF